MSTWAYTELDGAMAWPSARQCALTAEGGFGKNEDCLVPEYVRRQNSNAGSNKRFRWDSANALDRGGTVLEPVQKVIPREEEWNLELDGISMSETLEGAFTALGRSAESSKTTATRLDLSNGVDCYMKDIDILEEDADASVVTSSCHFSLTDVDPGIELFSGRNSAQKELEESWDAISNLDDMEDIFGHNGSPFGQADTGSSALQMRNDTCPSSQKPPPFSSPDSELKTLKNASSYPADQRPVKESSSQLSHENIVYWLGGQPAKQDQESLVLSSLADGFQPGFANAMASQQPVLGNIQQGRYGSQASVLQGPVIEQRKQQLQEMPHAMQPRSQVKKESDSWIDGRTFVPASGTQPEQKAVNSLAGSESEGFLDTAVLCQLGSTVSKLHIGTRLCISNALYRLAKSAAHRNGEESISADKIHATDVTNSRYGGLAPLETCTNPIDRAVASLLFYRQVPDEPQLSQDSTSGRVPPQPVVRSSDSWVQQPAPVICETAQSLPVVMANASGVYKLPLPAIHKSGYSDYSSSAKTRRGATTHHSSSSRKHFSRQQKPHVPVGGLIRCD